MKPILLSLAIALLMVGCGESDLSDPEVLEDATTNAVDWSKLQDRDGVTYLPNTQVPFSGYAKRAYGSEQVESLAQLKDGYVVRLKQWQENGNPKWDIGYLKGKVGGSDVPLENWQDSNLSHHDGLSINWYKNGQKQEEGNFKDGKPDELHTGWYENGQKKHEANGKDGKLGGLTTYWYENGQKTSEGNYKDGKFISAVVWKPNGEKCTVTNLKDGNGVIVWYNKDETEWFRNTYKDGERVED